MQNIDHHAVQSELNDKLFPHYLLGRQLALEQVLKKVLEKLPAKNIKEIKKDLQWDLETRTEKVQEQSSLENTLEHVSDCGYVSALQQMIFSKI